jgi:hypothetical protein
MVKGFDFNPFACFNGAAFAFKDDKTVADTERTEDMRPLMTGRFNHQFTVRIASQHAALEVETARDFFSRVAARTRRRIG